MWWMSVGWLYTAHFWIRSFNNRSKNWLSILQKKKNAIVIKLIRSILFNSCCIIENACNIASILYIAKHINCEAVLTVHREACCQKRCQNQHRIYWIYCQKDEEKIITGIIWWRRYLHTISWLKLLHRTYLENIYINQLSKK